jgi:hypothetical protein
MEPESSLPSSQETSTGPYPEPHQANLYNPTLNYMYIRKRFYIKYIDLNEIYMYLYRPSILSMKSLFLRSLINSI